MEHNMQQKMGILLTWLHIYTMEIIRQLRVLICFLGKWVLAAFVSAHSYSWLHGGSRCLQGQRQSLLLWGYVLSGVTNK